MNSKIQDAIKILNKIDCNGMQPINEIVLKCAKLKIPPSVVVLILTEKYSIPYAESKTAVAQHPVWGNPSEWEILHRDLVQDPTEIAGENPQPD